MGHRAGNRTDVVFVAQIEAYAVVELSPDASERDERPQREDSEAGS